MSGWIIQTITDLGYLGIMLLMLLEAVFPPIPSELIIPFAGFAAGQGELDFVLVILAATVGSLIGMSCIAPMSMPMSTIVRTGGGRNPGTGARAPTDVANVPAAYPLRSMDSAITV